MLWYLFEWLAWGSRSILFSQPDPGTMISSGYVTILLSIRFYSIPGYAAAKSRQQTRQGLFKLDTGSPKYFKT